MINFPENGLPNKETAVDLSDEERIALFGAAVRLLKTRGQINYPNPNMIYVNTERQEYRPEPTIEAEISAQEINSALFPDGTILVESDEINFGDEGPKELTISIERLATRLLEGEGLQPETFAYGTETAGVIMSQNDRFGLFIEDEYSDGSFTIGSEDTITSVDDVDSSPAIRLISNGSLFMDNATLFSRQDWNDIVSALSTVQ